MKLRCYLFSLLRIHRSDCEYCNNREACGEEMRKRLEELDWRTHSAFGRQDRGELEEGFDCTPREIANAPISLTRQREKIT